MAGILRPSLEDEARKYEQLHGIMPGAQRQGRITQLIKCHRQATSKDRAISWYEFSDSVFWIDVGIPPDVMTAYTKDSALSLPSCKYHLFKFSLFTFQVDQPELSAPPPVKRKSARLCLIALSLEYYSEGPGDQITAKGIRLQEFVLGASQPVKNWINRFERKEVEDREVAKRYAQQQGKQLFKLEMAEQEALTATDARELQAGTSTVGTVASASTSAATRLVPPTPWSEPRPDARHDFWMRANPGAPERYDKTIADEEAAVFAATASKGKAKAREATSELQEAKEVVVERVEEEEPDVVMRASTPAREPSVVPTTSPGQTQPPRARFSLDEDDSNSDEDLEEQHQEMTVDPEAMRSVSVESMERDDEQDDSEDDDGFNSARPLSPAIAPEVFELEYVSAPTPTEEIQEEMSSAQRPSVAASIRQAEEEQSPEQRLPTASTSAIEEGTTEVESRAEGVPSTARASADQRGERRRVDLPTYAEWRAIREADARQRATRE